MEWRGSGGDLFSQPLIEQRNAPLAERMRPQNVDEIIGQDHVIGPNSALGRAIRRDRLYSVILWGPPGSGKTTIARAIAHHTKSAFESLSAVLSGVNDVRKVVERARQRLAAGQKTILFIDEIHRFNKAQQDALLPHVEAGTIVLIGATTENPSFEIIPPLLSRCRVYVLNPLEPYHISKIIDKALADTDRGLGSLELKIDQKAKRILAKESRGDARRALTVLEIAAADAVAKGKKTISTAMIQEALAQRLLIYDKGGEEHYNVISAFIKSLRGSDPNAAVYWLARMIEAGEDPLFICRRMVIFAAEDIGLADPHALTLAVAAKEAVHFVGMPEAVLPMTEAVLYLAMAPKSNSVIETWHKAQDVVLDKGNLTVPMHLRNAPTGLMKRLGYGKDYKYPHHFKNHVVDETYLPPEIADMRFYDPKQPMGAETEILKRWFNIIRSAKNGSDDIHD